MSAKNPPEDPPLYTILLGLMPNLFEFFLTDFIADLASLTQ